MNKNDKKKDLTKINPELLKPTIYLNNAS